MNNAMSKPVTVAMEYLGDLRVASKHLRSGTIINTDAPVDNRGKGMSFSPTDLVVTSLGTCLLTIMGIEANRLGLNMNGVNAEVRKFMGANPRRIEKTEVYINWNKVKLTAEDKMQLKKAIQNCPVCNSLSKQLEIVVSYSN